MRAGHSRAAQTGRYFPMLPFKLAMPVCSLSLLLLPLALGRLVEQAAPPQPAMDLAAALEAGHILQDLNGDGVIDFVSARFILGDNAPAADLAAAADIAARLGHETMALNIPLSINSKQDAGVPIIVGAAGIARAGLDMAGLGLEDLAAGEGVVAAVDHGGSPVLVVTGRDDAGTRAGAFLFAARLPFLRDSKGPRIGLPAEEIAAFLQEQKIEIRSCTVTAARMRSGSGILERVSVDVETAAVNSAAAALRDQLRMPAPQGRLRPFSYPGVRLVAVRLRAPDGISDVVDIPGDAASPPAGPVPRRPGSAAKDKLDLSNMFTIDGLLGDSDSNLIPDRVDTLLVHDEAGAPGSIQMAARLGLESTGLSIPLVRPASEIERPESEPTLVLIGAANRLTDRLKEAGKLLAPALMPGEGLIQFVPRAFGEKGAVVITGADEKGVHRALAQAAERFPHIWRRGKDRTTLEDVEEACRRFLNGRSHAGQAATALYKLERLAADLSPGDLQAVHVKMFVQRPPEGFAEFVRREAGPLFPTDNVHVSVQSLDVREGRTVIEDDLEVPSEVDEFWRLFRSEVLPRVRKRQPVTLEARLSEPPEVREVIRQQARAELLRAGAPPGQIRVDVLSAYKQGYSWLYDVVRPVLRGKEIGQIRIRFAEIGAPPEWRHQAMFSATRWLLELFPIDEVLARDLGIDRSRIVFEKMPVGAPAYEVTVTAPEGAEILRSVFEPRLTVRPYFDKFPEYERVRVTTGWLTATVAGKTILDRRIVTDVERVWDHFQSRTLPAIYDHVMTVHEGNTRPTDAPFFGELRIEASLSEPNYRLGIDEEQISSLEALHEDLYFAVLHFFDVMGRYQRGQALQYPGRVIPVVRPTAQGEAGRLKVRFTGFDAPRPGVVVEYRERGGRSGKASLDIPEIALERPSAIAALVRHGSTGIERLDLRVRVDSRTDQRAELIRRAREEQVDRQVISADQVGGLLAALERLRNAGLYREALAYHDLREIRVLATWTDDLEPDSHLVQVLQANGIPPPFPDVRKVLPAEFRRNGQSIVQWDTPMPPDETAEVMAKLSTFPEATVYKAGESYLGNDIWALDLMPPLHASHWSQAKATTMKPTILFSARQHANEVSSTSHVLRMAELILTDASWRRILDRVNVVIHPMANPDGAQLAYDLYRITPDFMLHAGYLGALGVDITAAQWDDDPIYPESKVRPQLWRTWLPDIFANPHGYPSHEWVQLFSEYAAWVRNRYSESRDWWGMRGWFMPGFAFIDDPKHPRHKAHAMEIRERITRAINAIPEIKALNERSYDRYRRYGFEHDSKNFKLDFTDGVLIYTAIKGSKPDPRNADFMRRQPNVTIWSGTTEVPDETAYGDWLRLVANAGLEWNRALLDYLAEGNHVVERSTESFFGGSSLTMNRPRPPKPVKENSPIPRPDP